MFRVKGRGEGFCGFEISDLGIFVGFEFSGGPVLGRKIWQDFFRLDKIQAYLSFLNFMSKN